MRRRAIAGCSAVGRVAAFTGQAAEDRVAARYAQEGSVIARRWRGRGGEIDIIARQGASVVFVEVKAARDHTRAAESLRPAQMRRIASAAAEWLAGEPAGLDTEARFDVALVDGTGRIEILKDAFAA